MPKRQDGGGISARIGSKFFKELEEIKDARLRNGKSKCRVSTEKLTNMISKHKSHWDKIKEDMINATEEEIEKHGMEE